MKSLTIRVTFLLGVVATFSVANAQAPNHYGGNPSFLPMPAVSRGYPAPSEWNQPTQQPYQATTYAPTNNLPTGPQPNAAASPTWNQNSPAMAPGANSYVNSDGNATFDPYSNAPCADGGCNGGGTGYGTQYGMGTADYGQEVGADGGYGCAGGGYGMGGGAFSGGLFGGMQQYQGYGGGSFAAAIAGRAQCSGWFGSVGALVMTRDDENDVWLSYASDNFSRNLLSSRSASMNWAGGVQTRFGRYFNCGANAIEVVYWGLYPSSESASAIDGNTPNNISSAIDFQTLDITGIPVNGWFNNANRHRVSREWSFHNIELNLLGGSCLSGIGTYANCCSDGACQPALQLSWVAGVRYFRIKENFEFASSETDTVYDYTDDDVFYEIRTTNNLIGFQLGGQGVWCINDRFAAVCGTKFGLYANHITHHSCVGTANDYAVVNDPSPGSNDGRVFNIQSTKTDVAFIGELNLHLRYRLSCRWSASIGWRAVALTGVALPTNQIPHHFGDIDGVANIDSNGSMILHGGYANCTFNF